MFGAFSEKVLCLYLSRPLTQPLSHSFSPSFSIALYLSHDLRRSPSLSICLFLFSLYLFPLFLSHSFILQLWMCLFSLQPQCRLSGVRASEREEKLTLKCLLHTSLTCPGSGLINTLSITHLYSKHNHVSVLKLASYHLSWSVNK